MKITNCPSCGAPFSNVMVECRYCGAKISSEPVSEASHKPPRPQNPPFAESPKQPFVSVHVEQYASVAHDVPPPQFRQPNYYAPAFTKSKNVAGLLAIFLGSLGIHKFYLGQIGKGVVYLIFCWTYIPFILSIIEGFNLLFMSQEKFFTKYAK